MRPRPTFQEVILELQRFWSEHGCVIWQPYYTQVGAGTMNPATYLRVLGPEPWRVGYVEPSIRPDDGRYGENPNRLQQHYQFQVILKPDPGNPQELYLQSLAALGIDPLEHDLRFVEDNWEAPALGAWGLGWEVWLDGQEITQFTYFQQAGGMVLDPVSVEITYGLERILIALHGASHFADIPWTDDRTYGDLNLQGEREHSAYYFEHAAVERLWAMFREYEGEAKSALAAGLVLPAHDYVLKCSHTFNILDTRGAVGVTERAALFGRMRDLSRQVAEAYVAQRAAMGHPWRREAAASVPAAAADPQPHPTAPAPLLVEIGVEELPPGDLESALAQLREAVPQALEAARLQHGGLRILGTPRRLVILVEALDIRQADRVSQVKGPPADRAFDASGAPTAAAAGFARGRGVAVESLRVVEMDGGRYAVADVAETGQPAEAALLQRLPEIVGGLRFERSMRWNSDAAFSRPIRWLVALHGAHVVPFTHAGLTAGRTTRGLRFSTTPEFEVKDVQDYSRRMQAEGILLDPKARRAAIRAQVDALAAKAGGEVGEAAALMLEVTHLVEAPTAFLGSFDPAMLELPAEVLESVMNKHQRYFAVKHDGRLLPVFIGVRNGGAGHLDIVRDGNEHVLRARFADAKYFVQQDLRSPLESYLPALARLTFQTRLGSMLDKAHRVERLTEQLAGPLGLTAEERATALRAARLCKADLATQMVVEMTSLQGILGREYARRSGEPEAVAEAILEHHLPRSADDRLPATPAGMAVGIADRLDTLVGLFAVGLQPSGAKDPYALRRAAIGLIQILTAKGRRVDLRLLARQAASGMPVEVPEEVLSQVLDFIEARHAVLLSAAHRHDVIESVLAAQGWDPAGAEAALPALEAAAALPDWPPTLQAYARCVRITRSQVQRGTVDPARLVEPAEKALYEAVQRAEAADRRAGSVEDFLQAFRPLVPPITRFFEDVLVMADDPALQANRLVLLQRIAALAEGVADLSRLEGF
jgi:glycyl-tRNA synthetase